MCVVYSVWENKLNRVKQVLCQDLRCSAVPQEPSGNMYGTIPFLTSGPGEPVGGGSLWLPFLRTCWQEGFYGSLSFLEFCSLISVRNDFVSTQSPKSLFIVIYQ